MFLKPASKRQTASVLGLSVPSILMLSFSLLWCIIWAVHSWGYWEDDAYIHLEFARNLATGHGFSFNGMVVNGDTAPLWVALLALSHWFIPNYLIAGKVLVFLGMVFALTGLFVFSRRLISFEAEGDSFAAAMVLLVVVNPYFCYWSFSGMETVTAVGLALWCFTIATGAKPSWSRFFPLCLLAGLAPLLRPEMVFFTGLFSILLLYYWYALASGKTLSRRLSTFVLGLFLIAVPVLLWALYARHAFGHFVPNTNAAKRADAGDSVLMRLLNVYSLGFPMVLIGILAGAVYCPLHFNTVRSKIKSLDLLKSPMAAIWIFGGWSFIAAAFYLVDHTKVQTRYILVMAVGLMVVIFAVVRVISRKAYNAFIALGLLSALGVSCNTVWPLIRNKAISDAALQNLAVFINREIPANDPVAAFYIGELAFFSQHPIIDTGGITRPSAIPFEDNPKALLEWARSQGAVYYVTDDKPEPGSVLVREEPAPLAGWFLNPRHYAEQDPYRLWKLADASDRTATQPVPLQP